MEEILMIPKLLLSVFLGSLIGYERQLKAKPAGLRTHMLICLGSTLLTIMSLTAFPNADTSRMAAYILVGIGFIGGGTIFQFKDKVIGLTTAASLWVVASIGIAVGVGYYLLASITTLIVYIILKLSVIESEIKE
ncbi:MAG: MgtC/SapB family protein [Candidatus Aenigmarchaeota archaeon]|nr:MgtC/SapB family protein [Candidatus Aenigmarchaeota archaeon]